jgi:hypothetical protein
VIRLLPYWLQEIPGLVHVVFARNGVELPPTLYLLGKSMTSLNGVMEVAARNANSGNDIAIGAGQIIARRVALGMAAAFDPLGADHTEFGRMVPEKMEALSAAGMIMMQQASQAGEQISRFATDAITTAARASIAMAGSGNLVAFAEAQGRFTMAWCEQAAANFLAIGMLALGAQQAAMVPIQERIAANTERLGR